MPQLGVRHHAPSEGQPRPERDLAELQVPQLGVRLDHTAEPQQLAEGATFRLGSSKVVYRVAGCEPVKVARGVLPPPPLGLAEEPRDSHTEIR